MARARPRPLGRDRAIGQSDQLCELPGMDIAKPSGSGGGAHELCDNVDIIVWKDDPAERW